MTELDDDVLKAHMASAAAILDLALDPAWEASILANLKVSLRLANLAADFALPDESEPAPVFEA